MKRGQIQIIFTWIFILVLIGFILIYGIKFIRETKQLGENVILINFFQKLDDKIQLYYSLDIGSSSVEEFKLNNKIKYVCFTKDGDFGDTPSDVDRGYLDNLKSYDNVFIIPPIYENSRVNISNLDITNNPSCISLSGGLLKLRLNTTIGGVDVKAE